MVKTVGNDITLYGIKTNNFAKLRFQMIIPLVPKLTFFVRLQTIELTF